jgi:dipeptidyl aminopeptidase/acylaminoacyl peptidase
MSKLTSRIVSQPLDRAALTLLLALIAIISGLILGGGHSAPRVSHFNWEDKTISAADIAFTLSFSRPMDQTSVEEHLKIAPDLPGKISWAGRRMAYTLALPIEYGKRFKLDVEGAKERSSAHRILQPFSSEFSSRDRAFAYIGADSDQAGRLVLVNMTLDDRQVLTPPNFQVIDFRPYPDREKILFAATERSSKPQGIAEQKLYTVTTGFGSQPRGQVELVLDNQDYQNLKFDLSQDGEVIVVQRVNRRNTNEFGPWILRANGSLEPLKTEQPGGDFLITPDSSALAIAQGQGMAILPLQTSATPLSFLPKFGMVLGFSRDGSTAAMLKFNTDFTRSLFLVTNQGIQKEVLKTTGSIRSAVFDPSQSILFCLLTKLLPGETYQEQPFLAAIDLKTALKDPSQAFYPLLQLPQQREIQVSLAPDGRAILFDQTSQDPNNANTDQTSLANSRLWILPTENLLAGDWTPSPPIDVLPGLHPRWLP